VHRSVLRNEDNIMVNTKIMKQGRWTEAKKYSGPKEPGSSNLAGHKVSWAYGTKNSTTGAKISARFLKFSRNGW